jgi:chromosome segregation protein
LASFRIASFSKSLADIEEKEQIQRVEKSGIATQIDTLEADLQQQKLDSLTKEKNLAAQQKTTNEFTAKIRAYESEKRIKNEQLKHQQDKETRLKDELERDNNQLKHVQYNIKRLAEEKLQEDENLHSITLRVAELKEAVDELRLSQNEARNGLK